MSFHAPVYLTDETQVTSGLVHKIKCTRSDVITLLHGNSGKTWQEVKEFFPDKEYLLNRSQIADHVTDERIFTFLMASGILRKWDFQDACNLRDALKENDDEDDKIRVIFVVSKIVYGQQRKQHDVFNRLAGVGPFEVFEAITDELEDEYLKTHPDNRKPLVSQIADLSQRENVLPRSESGFHKIALYCKGRRDPSTLSSVGLTGFGLSVRMLLKFLFNLVDIVESGIDNEKFGRGCYGWIMQGRFELLPRDSGTETTPWSRFDDPSYTAFSLVEDHDYPLSEATAECGVFMSLLKWKMNDQGEDILSFDFGDWKALSDLGWKCDEEWAEEMNWKIFMRDFVHEFVDMAKTHTIGFYICKQVGCHSYAAYMTWMNARFRVNTKKKAVLVLFELCRFQSFGVRDRLDKRFNTKRFFYKGSVDGKIRRGDDEYFVVFYLNYESWLRSRAVVRQMKFEMVEDLTLVEFESVLFGENYPDDYHQMSDSV